MGTARSSARLTDAQLSDAQRDVGAANAQLRIRQPALGCVPEQAREIQSRAASERPEAALNVALQSRGDILEISPEPEAAYTQVRDHARDIRGQFLEREILSTREEEPLSGVVFDVDLQAGVQSGEDGGAGAGRANDGGAMGHGRSFLRAEGGLREETHVERWTPARAKLFAQQKVRA
jgi:hypothetical protein